MSKSRVIVLSVVEAGLSKAEAARRFGVSWRWVHILVQRYEAESLDGLEPGSRRPHANPRATPEPVRIRILELREKLAASGLDAGPATIAWHLAGEGVDPPPAISTIRRVITAAGLVASEPRKRPKASLHRFAAEQPNETWQSDFTHWPLADGTDVEILTWLDDHSRYLVSSSVHTPVTGEALTGRSQPRRPPLVRAASIALLGTGRHGDQPRGARAVVGWTRHAARPPPEPPLTTPPLGPCDPSSPQRDGGQAVPGGRWRNLSMST